MAIPVRDQAGPDDLGLLEPGRDSWLPDSQLILLDRSAGRWRGA